MPASHTETDAPYKDEKRNLIVCPLLHDGNFMQIFYEGWQVVQTFLAADARVPSEAALPRPPMREVARVLEDRRDFPIPEIVDQALSPLAQPHLLDTEDEQAEVSTKGPDAEIQAVIAPEAAQIDS